jgi:hypothetical protein
VDAGHPQTERRELRGLIVHEGDERGYDQRCAAAGQRRKLVAEALTGARGHYKEDIAACGGSLADLLLMGAEGAVTEDAMQKLGEGLGLLKGRHRLRLSSHNLCLPRLLGLGPARVLRCRARLDSAVRSSQPLPIPL